MRWYIDKIRLLVFLFIMAYVVLGFAWGIVGGHYSPWW